MKNKRDDRAFEESEEEKGWMKIGMFRKFQ